jgi:transposase
LVHETLDQRLIDDIPKRLIRDKVYGSDKLDDELAEKGIEMIAPNRANRAKTQDGRPLRRYKRRWKVERLFAWIQNYRRCLNRFEYRLANYEGFLKLVCIIILTRYL